MYIHNSNLTIRDATADDAEQLAEWWNDGEVMAHAGFPLGLGTTAEKVAESLKLDRDDTRRRLIIEVDSVRVGEMSYRRVDAVESNTAADAGNNDKASDPYAARNDGNESDLQAARNAGNESDPHTARNDGTPLAPTAEIGIKICDPASQNRGIGKRLLCMLISELFRMGYEKIILDTNLKNTRAQHVYERLGFRRLRVNVDSWRDQLGRLQSSVDYELRPSDFTGVASDFAGAASDVTGAASDVADTD